MLSFLVISFPRWKKNLHKVMQYSVKIKKNDYSFYLLQSKFDQYKELCFSVQKLKTSMLIISFELHRSKLIIKFLAFSFLPIFFKKISQQVKRYPSMESSISTSLVSAPVASHQDELFMQQRMLFSDSLNVSSSSFISFVWIQNTFYDNMFLSNILDSLNL